MSLRFAICGQCHESHAVRANGLMSIHQTAAGKRCAPPEPAARPASRQERLERRRLPQRVLPETPHEELEAAFAVAAERKKSSQRDQPPAFDRRIYAVGGAHVVRGGLPTLGRGRRNG